MSSFLLRALRRLRIAPLWLAAALLAAVLLHIGLVLALAHLGSNPAVAALTAAGNANAMTVLPPVAPGHQPLPYLSPADRYAICRFDLRKGPVVIHAVLGSDDWTVAIHAPDGANVYAVSGADLGRREVDLLLAAADSQGAALPIAKDAGTTTAVGLTTRTGIAIISAPAMRSAEAGRIERLLSQATCNPRYRTGEPGG